MPGVADILEHARICGDAVAEHFEMVSGEGCGVGEQPVEHEIMRIFRDLRGRLERAQSFLEGGDGGAEISEWIHFHILLEQQDFFLSVIESDDAEEEISGDADGGQQDDEQQPEECLAGLFAFCDQNVEADSDMKQQKTAVNEPLVMFHRVSHLFLYGIPYFAVRKKSTLRH